MELVSLAVKQPYRLREHGSCEIIDVVEFDMFSGPLPFGQCQVNHPGGSTVVSSLSAKCNDKALKVLPHFLRLLIRIIEPSDAESAGSANSGKPGTVT
ncbi:hypothetical protein WN944_016691 [Citrus x changshan-huyou]|uniref:Uncharacterized protein n=1 Tax=Citrus x changshan-huyou TaxID=2935761 RepID=A0AAP0M9T3_9ROSI